MKKIISFTFLLLIGLVVKGQFKSNIEPSVKYSDGNLSILTDDVRGNKDDLEEGWVGFEGADIELSITLPKPKIIRELKIGSIRHQVSWVFLPREIELITTDITGKKHTYNYTSRVLENRKGILKRDFTFQLDSVEIKSVTISITAQNKCPEWHVGNGKPAWLFLDEIQLNEEKTPLTNGERGLYFSHKKYEYQSLPTFNEVKDQLPKPILEGNKKWLDMYWFCWELAFNKLRTPEMGSPFVSNYIDEAFSPNIYQWDTHFMILFWKYAHHLFPAIESHDNFYRMQHSDGYICREISEIDGSDYVFIDIENTINPPLFPWVEMEYAKWSKDYSRFEKILPALEKYVEWIEKNRKQKSQHNLYWQTNLGSGMDNSPRRGNGWIDMSAQMSLYYSCLGEICKKIDNSEKASQYKLKSQQINEDINKWMWEKELKNYFDVNYDGIPIKTYTIASFWPLLSKTASDNHKDELLKILKDSTKFWTNTPIPTLSADEKEFYKKGDYWLGGVWAPTNYAVIKGLDRYEEYQLSNEISSKYLASMYEVYKKTGTVWENYSPTTMEQGNWSKKDFVGWTGLGPISLLIENIIGIKLVDGSLVWNITRNDKHGIENLRVGDNKIDLVFENNEALIKTKENLNIKIIMYNTQKELNLTTGRHRIKF